MRKGTFEDFAKTVRNKCMAFELMRDEWLTEDGRLYYEVYDYLDCGIYPINDDDITTEEAAVENIVGTIVDLYNREHWDYKVTDFDKKVGKQLKFVLRTKFGVKEKEQREIMLKKIDRDYDEAPICKGNDALRNFRIKQANNAYGEE